MLSKQSSQYIQSWLNLATTKAIPMSWGGITHLSLVGLTPLIQHHLSGVTVVGAYIFWSLVTWYGSKHNFGSSGDILLVPAHVMQYNLQARGKKFVQFLLSVSTLDSPRQQCTFNHCVNLKSGPLRVLLTSKWKYAAPMQIWYIFHR